MKPPILESRWFVVRTQPNAGTGIYGRYRLEPIAQ